LDTDVLAIPRVFSDLVPRFGCNHAMVYRCLLSVEAKTASSIIRETKLCKQVVYRVIKDLVLFGLIKRIGSGPTMFFADKPVQKMGVLINRKKKLLDEKVLVLKKIIGNATGLSGEDYLIRLNGGQQKLVNSQTRLEVTDKDILIQMKRTIEEKIREKEKAELKPWQVIYR
jgi:sugar-specific transcriptional regulator TrmB